MIESALCANNVNRHILYEKHIFFAYFSSITSLVLTNCFYIISVDVLFTQTHTPHRHQLSLLTKL